MALTKATLIDLNSNELILDLDADTSITADTDDTIHFKISGSDEITMTAAGLSPASADGNALGTAALEWSDLYLADGGIIYLGADQDVTLTHVHNEGLLLNSTMKLEFNDASQFIQGSSATVLSIGATDEIDLTATAIDINGTCDVSGAFSLAGTAITTTAAEINLIDGGTARGTDALASGDGILINDGGTMKMTNVDTVKTFMGISFANDANNRVLTADGSNGINGEANLTFDGSTLTNAGATQLNSTLTSGVDGQGYDTKFFGDTAGAYILWDTSADKLLTAGGALVDIVKDKLMIGGTAVTTTAAELNILDTATLDVGELNILDGATVTTAELNLIDGGTARGTTAVASGDGILINDGGSMAMTNVDTVSTYFASHSVGGGNIVTTGALDSGSITSGFGAIDNGTSNIRSATITAETAFVPDASGGADLGTTALEFNDAFFNDSAVINFGDDQDTTLTHTDGTGLTLNSTNKLCFNDASQFVQGSSATVLSIGATDEVDITATLVDINANVEISGTATTTGVHTFSAVPVLPANSIDSAHYVDGSIDNAHIGDDQIDSEHYVDGSIDKAHLSTAMGDCSDRGFTNIGLNAGDKITFTDNTDMRFTVNAGEEMRLEADGDLHVDGDVIAYSTTISDERLKENITTITDALDKVNQIRGVEFTHKDSGKKSAGVIAQELEKVLPQAVREKKLPLQTDGDELYKTVEYNQLHGLLIESIKELRMLLGVNASNLEAAQKRIEILENR